MKNYMELAYKEAEKAAKLNEVPVGCIVTYNGAIIAKTHNLTRTTKDPTAHAELLAIRAAAEIKHSENLKGCALYVTMEPCPMCAGALIEAQIDKLVYGCSDYTYGASGGFFNLMSHSYAKNIEVYGGIMEEECSILMKDFFKTRR